MQGAHWLPPRIFLVGLLGRATACWVGSRLLLSVAGVQVAPAGIIITIAVSAVLSALETRRRHLDLLLPNLGVSRITLWALHLLPPILGEAVLHGGIRT